MKISIIAAMAHQQVIGNDNKMPWLLPADLAHFKRITLGKPILMGRKTFESIGKPLPGRRNIVISRNPNYHLDGAEVVHSFAQAYALLLANDPPDELMVIGGAELYRELLPHAHCLYLTHIDLHVEGDTYFPPYQGDRWSIIESTSHPADEKNPYPYRFETLISR